MINYPTPLRILISSCLLGAPVRFDGQSKAVFHPALEIWQQKGSLIACCPEILAGMTVPRIPCEISAGDGFDIIQGQGQVINKIGENQNDLFLRGANRSLDLYLQQGAKLAILKDNSPSCGLHSIYNGEFKKHTRKGVGVTTALFKSHLIPVFSENEIDLAYKFWLKLLAQLSKSE